MTASLKNIYRYYFLSFLNKSVSVFTYLGHVILSSRLGESVEEGKRPKSRVIPRDSSIYSSFYGKGQITVPHGSKRGKEKSFLFDFLIFTISLSHARFSGTKGDNPVREILAPSRGSRDTRMRCCNSPTPS